MKKDLIIIFCITALAVSLCACGNAANQKAEAQQISDTQTETDDFNESFSEESTAEIIEPEHVTVSMTEVYGDTNFRMELLGFQEYDMLEGEDYTDTPQEGNVFLVLFADIQNHTIENDYINPQLLSTTVDGIVIENTFLVNNPENYKSLFQHVNMTNDLTGYIVWEVPADWQELSLTYSGWEGSAHVIVSASLTPEDIQTPPALEKIE